jgi:hypothetical protein
VQAISIGNDALLRLIRVLPAPAFGSCKELHCVHLPDSPSRTLTHEDAAPITTSNPYISLIRPVTGVIG